MKRFQFIFILLYCVSVLAVDIKISQLPLGSGAAIGVNDSFPYVQASNNITKRLTIYDLVNVPLFTATYAPKANPTFTGVVTAPSFVGPLTGNASTATALAANPTDCASNTFANAIAANGNLTCAAVNVSTDITGAVPIANGGTGQTTKANAFDALSPMTTGGDLIYGGTSGTGTRLANGSAGAILRSAGGTSAPAWTTATYPATTTANQILYSSATNTVTGLAVTNLSALTTNGSGVPTYISGAVGNRVLRTDGTTITFSAVGLSTDVTGTLPIANGGTNNNSLGVTSGGVVYGDGTRLQTSSAGTSGQFLKSNGSSAPTFSSFTAPTVNTYSSGSGTYTVPAGTLYLIVEMCGGGGGGGANGSGPSTGTGGGNTTFGSATAGGGAVGPSSGGGAGGAGGTNTLAYTTMASSAGGYGTAGYYNTDGAGANGAPSFYGAGGVGGFRGVGGGTSPGGNGIAPCSGGGGGGGNATYASGPGGGAGAWQRFMITSPSASYSYGVGAAGTLGGAGGGGNNGGNGAAGFISVTAYAQ